MRKNSFILFLYLILCCSIPGFSQTDSIDTVSKSKELLAKGIGYYTGRNGYTRDFQKAYDYLIEAAGYDNTDAECVLAHMYENGNGVEKDYTKAFEWYMKAAQKNSVRAQSSIAFFYDEGMGVEQSFVEAAKWYQKAAENNDGASQYNLADMYANGIGVETDYDKALELFRKALANGVSEASKEITKVNNMKTSGRQLHVDEFGDTIYTLVTVQPEFPGGQQAVLQFLRENVKYPAIARENRIQGRVVVQFTINTDGSVTDLSIARSVNDVLDKEALRVISLMPNWTPGYLNGKPVRVRYSIPINFRLN